MWHNQSRDQVWSQLDRKWDIIIIGGGITGAGVFHEAVSRGFSTLLVDAHDFASGTSSRSSKLVHGGFRYLKNGQVRLTYESVREREHLLREGRGLVNRLGFLLANYQGDAIPGWMFAAGLTVYDLLALRWEHRHYDAYDIHDLCPYLCEDDLHGGFRYFDAQTDDARLVLRLIEEGTAAGGVALNYTRAAQLLQTADGQVCGVALNDGTPEGCGRTAEVQARVIVNAAGAWADDLRGMFGGKARLRKLRGSHLIFPAARLPLTRAVSFLHPFDQRPVMAIPWEGVTLIGTTDVDQPGPVETDTAISPQEFTYLLEGAQRAFACLDLTPEDVQATFSGVRPVIDTHKADPSKESREHILWQENGLLTLAGGKLTTFRLMARDVLRRANKLLPQRTAHNAGTQLFIASAAEFPQPVGLSPLARLRLTGRHGANVALLVETAEADELTPIEKSPNLWAELRWAARAEAVVHLDDLLLRRVRLGLHLPQGGLGELKDRIRQIVQPELGWNDERWQTEVNDYANLWKRCYYINP